MNLPHVIDLAMERMGTDGNGWERMYKIKMYKS